MDDILKFLDLNGCKDLPADYGAFSMESWVAKYNFSFDELSHDLQEYNKDGTITENIKTVLHERTHYCQTATTPYGFYIYTLRKLQTQIVVLIINQIKNKTSLRIFYPLIDFLKLNHVSVPAPVARAVQLWYAIEFLIMFLLGEADQWLRQGEKNQFLQNVSIVQIFYQIEHFLEYSEKSKSLPFNAPLDLFARTEEEKNLCNVLTALTGSGGDQNLLAILESSGMVSEFWGNKSLSFEQFQKQFPRFHRTEQFLNHGAIGYAKDRIKTNNVQEFVISYLALCDVILFCPILHQLKTLRHNKFEFADFHPIIRWQKAVDGASHVGPMKSLQDYSRFTNEICEILGWPAPAIIIQETLNTNKEKVSNLQETTYVQSQTLRQTDPWMFLDYEFYLSANTLSAKIFLEAFNYPIICYKDRTTYHNNKFILDSLTMDYLIRIASRTIFLRSDLSISLPYEAEKSERNFLRNKLIKTFEDLIGIRISSLSIC